LLQASRVVDGRTWPGAVALLAITLIFSVSSAGVLVAVPFLALTMMLGLRRLPVAVAAMVAVFVAVGVPARGGVWYLERGWTVVLAAWFVVLTTRWPRSRFFPRALGAVAATAVVVGILAMFSPGSWSMVNWLITEGMMRSVSLVAQLFMAVDSDVSLSTAQLNTLYEWAERQGRLFPALLGLSSLSGLAVAWWAYVRLSAGSSLGLRPLRDFRFNDHLVWLLLTGLALIVFGGGDGWTSAGSNAVVFMGGLYAMRGAAVLLFLNGGMTGFGFVFLAVGMFFLAPVLIMGALVVGVGDTWLDLRSKATAIAGGQS
jgi:hypothetical protein